MEFLVGGIRGTQYLFGRPARAGIAPIAKSLGFGAASDEQILTVDGSEIQQTHQLRLVVYPIIYRVSYIPGGAGFLPSTVLLVFSGDGDGYDF